MQDNTPNINPEVNPENTAGTVSGFDSVGEQGYTVTPNGGFYTKPAADIIQDEPIKPSEPEPAPESRTEPQASADGYSSNPYRPTGNYGAYNAGGYTPPQPTQYYYQQPRPKKTKKPRNNTSGSSVVTVVLSVVLALAIGALSGAAAASFVMKDNTSEPLLTPNKNNVSITVDEKNVGSVAQAVAEKASDSVVGIRTTTSVVNFFGGVSETPGEGSGVIYSADGYIITNYHVIESAVTAGGNSKIEVFLHNSKDTPYSAAVVGYNISSDLAVIKIEAKGLSPVEIGNSDELSVGQYVVTIGSPGGLEFMGSVTYGIISGLDRVVSSNSKVPLIQTDAAINPGNSGGALLNTTGKLIGINSSKIVSEEFEGMGFAIPVNTVVEKVERIISRQNEAEPYIGITVSERYSPEVLSYYGFPAGAVVLSVDEGSPAENAGIQKGDIITEFDGNEISEYQLLGEYLNDCDPEQTVEAKIYRSGRYYTVKLTVGSNN